jgi:hypothetical protein
VKALFIIPFGLFLLILLSAVVQKVGIGVFVGIVAVVAALVLVGLKMGKRAHERSYRRHCSDDDFDLPSEPFHSAIVCGGCGSGRRWLSLAPPYTHGSCDCGYSGPVERAQR